MALWGRPAKVNQGPPATEQQPPVIHPFLEFRDYEVWYIGGPTPLPVRDVNIVNVHDGFVFFSRDFQIVAAFRQDSVERFNRVDAADAS